MKCTVIIGNSLRVTADLSESESDSIMTHVMEILRTAAARKCCRDIIAEEMTKLLPNAEVIDRRP